MPEAQGLLCNIFMQSKAGVCFWDEGPRGKVFCVSQCFTSRALLEVYLYIPASSAERRFHAPFCFSLPIFHRDQKPAGPYLLPNAECVTPKATVLKTFSPSDNPQSPFSSHKYTLCFPYFCFSKKKDPFLSRFPPFLSLLFSSPLFG